MDLDRLLALPESELILELDSYDFEKRKEIYDNSKYFRALYKYMDHSKTKFGQTLFSYFYNSKYTKRLMFLAKKNLINFKKIDEDNDLFSFYGDYSFLKLIKNNNIDIDINGTTDDGDTFLHLINFNKKTLLLALEMGFDINKTNSRGETIFHDRDINDIELLRFGLENGLDPTIKSHFGKTVFDITKGNTVAYFKEAIKYGVKPSIFSIAHNLTYRLFKLAIDNDIDVFKKDYQDKTVFEYATNIDTKIFKFFLDNYAEPGKRFFILLKRNIPYDIMKMAIDHGLETRYFYSILQHTKITHSMLELIVENGLNINLYPSIIDLDNIETAIDLGFNPNNKNYSPNYKKTICHALHDLTSKHIDILLKGGFNPNIQDLCGNTFLHKHQCYLDHHDMLKATEYGLWNSKNNRGEYISDYFINRNKIEF